MQWKKSHGPVDEHQSMPRRGDLHEEALWEARVACHEPAPIAIVGVTCKVAFWTDDQGPLVGLDKGGG